MSGKTETDMLTTKLCTCRTSVAQHV